ncbi:hypothetical protein GUJ93_ZPchr0015g6921 [Zizania palustris]|uniref:Myb/SANT-like domain-containing protein n=1 Tax=Zizania palustris TaxID=103762 RepID=A0A8J5W653_ZIZPA|nr:hypothetical protein GUJ93_ZPchr0015g6921 [Zizania palustris]
MSRRAGSWSAPTPSAARPRLFLLAVAALLAQDFPREDYKKLTNDMEKGKKSGSGMGYISWNDDMDKSLLDTFVECYNKGDRCQNGWKSHVYTTAIKNVREKCNVEITKDNIMSRNKTFDKHHTIINDFATNIDFRRAFYSKLDFLLTSLEDMEKGKKSGSGRGYISWNDDMDKALLDTFVECYNKVTDAKMAGSLMSTRLLSRMSEKSAMWKSQKITSCQGTRHLTSTTLSSMFDTAVAINVTNLCGLVALPI